MSSKFVYHEYLLANNDLQNNLHTITGVGLIPHEMDWGFYIQYADKTYRMKEIFTKAFLFYSIKKTHNTDITGHFLFVIANEHYEAAREALRSE
jgi:hypothetical protein